MWKKIAVLMAAVMLCVVGTSGNFSEVSAAETGAEINAKIEAETEETNLLTEDAIVGYMTAQTRGVYLSGGYSVIRDAGSGKIVAGGGTDAATFCDVSVNVIVERLEGGSWYRVTSWTGSRTNALTVMSSKTLSVGRGYYYRVRCVHFANSDVGSSCTSSLLM